MALVSINSGAEQAIWKRLRQISTVSFNADSGNPVTGWHGTGNGTVEVEIVSPDAIVFSETGIWETRSRQEMAFSNRYRWSMSSGDKILELEHLRYGAENPVKLLDLYCDSESRWKTVTPHTCNKDLYSLEIFCSDSSVSMNWHITGPSKNESITYRYQ